jgi:uncharacterized protein YuzE
LTRFVCGYLNGEVEPSHERELHIAEWHPDLLPEHRERVSSTPADHRLHRSAACRRRGRMVAKLSFRYDRDADILHIDKRAPYPERESEELGDEIIARLNPETGEVKSLEALFFSTRLLRGDLFELPIVAELRLAVGK